MDSGAALCGECRAGSFRLPGRSGVGLFIRTSLILDEQGGPRLCADVELLTPTAWVAVLHQPVPTGLGSRLSEFLNAAAHEPAQLREDALGLHLDATPDGDDIHLQITTFSEPEPRSVSTVTSVKALTRSAREALSLESAGIQGEE